MTYTQAAVERAMKVHEVLMQALNGRQPWIQVAEVLGVSARTVRRLRWRYERDGFTGLYDHRHHTPSPRAVPLAEVQRILQLYRDRYGPRDGHPGFNVRHFYERARREHGVTVSYSFVKKALQAAHLVGKRRPRGRHRRRREPRPCFGELLHLDGSRHRWLALVPDAYHTALVIVDDATKHVLYAQLVEGGESVAAIMTALQAVLATHGIPGALYTDRASWAVTTPTSGTDPDRTRLTQVGRALARLGVEHIVGFSPQARGRSERANGTLQGRLVNELRVAGIRTLPAANRYRGSTSSPRTTRRLVGRPPILTARSCPSCATTSRRSSAMKRNASSPATTPSPSSASCSSSTNSAAAAPVPASGCSCVATSMGSIRCGGGRAASAASRPPDAHSERRRPDPGGSQADRSRVKRERSDHLSTTATPRQRNGRPRLRSFKNGAPGVRRPGDNSCP